jgi:hypothetical protein
MDIVSSESIVVSPAAPSTVHVAQPTSLVLLQNKVVELFVIACVKGFGVKLLS